MPGKGATQPGPIAAALYQKAKHGIPECAGCGAKLKHTPAYSKHGGRTGVKAHFGLRRGLKHAFGCKYDINATLQKIVAKSHEVRDLGAAALVEHVGSQEQETVEFRLHVLLAGLETEQILGRQDKDAEKAYVYRDSKRCLSTYMNCVESIIMVADVVGDDAQLEEKVHVVFNGKKIPWRDFFFGFKEHRRLWRSRDKTQGRPVTLEFERRDLERKVAAPYRANGYYQISGRFDLEEGNPPVLRASPASGRGQGAGGCDLGSKAGGGLRRPPFQGTGFYPLALGRPSPFRPHRSARPELEPGLCHRGRIARGTAKSRRQAALACGAAGYRR